MPSLEERLQQLTDAGVDEEVLADLRNAYEASPIRKERDAAKQEAAGLKARLAEQNFAAAGVKVKPAALNVPSDLDVTDVEKVRGWATDMGLVDAKPDTDPAELRQHDRIAAASSAAPGSGGTGDLQSRILNELDPDKLSEAEFWEKAGSYGVTSRRLPGAKDLSSGT